MPSSNAKGIEAAEVLACSETVRITFSRGKPKCLAVASIMRLLAWCGTNQSIFYAGKFASLMVSFATSDKALTANLNTA